MTEAGDERIDLLLKEFDEHRHAIKEMISQMEEIRNKVDRLIPMNLDARYIRFFEEKVKSITNLFSTLLEMRKEITKSVKDEIELRRKLEKVGKPLDDLLQSLDVRSIALQVEEIAQDQRKKREVLEQKVKERELERVK